jgi:hypothetical protein
MPLTEREKNQLAMVVLQKKLENNGNLKLMPSKIKEEVKKFAKKAGISKEKSAEFLKIILTEGYKKTIIELNKIINNSGNKYFK